MKITFEIPDETIKELEDINKIIKFTSHKTRNLIVFCIYHTWNDICKKRQELNFND